MDVMIVLPFCDSSFNVTINDAATVESSPLVGSMQKLNNVILRNQILNLPSRKITEGLINNSVPILTRFFSPPLIYEITVVIQFSRCNVFMILLTCSNFSLCVKFPGSRNNPV